MNTTPKTSFGMRLVAHLGKCVSRAVIMFLSLSPMYSFCGVGTTYFHNDLSGSPQVATNASGQIIWRESYFPYGERIVLDPASIANKVWFTGRHQDDQTELLYMGARYYDPVLGRFLTVDPELFDQQNIHSFNRYAYANNNPYRFVDSSGRYAEEIVGAFSLALSIQAFKHDPSLANGGILAADIILTAIPGIPAFAGAAVHGSGAILSTTTKGATGRVALDANAIIARLEGSSRDVQAVVNAMAGRSPNVSITAVKEFLKGGGDVAALRSFLVETGGGMGKAPSRELVEQLQGLGLKANDARIVGSAIEEGVPLLTRDKRVLKRAPGVAEPF